MFSWRKSKKNWGQKKNKFNQVSRQFHLTILGSNSAVPAYGRFPTSQALKINNHLFLIDCGEGTQIRAAQYKVKRNQIDCIFISHLHGDHLYGLPGLLTSMSLNSRTKAIKVFGPVGIKRYLDTVFELSRAYMSFELELIELDNADAQTILDLPDVKVTAFPVYHRLPCYGYKFEEKQKEANVIKQSIKDFQLTVEEIKMAKEGLDIQRPNALIPNDLLTHPRAKPASYAFCADSEAKDELIEDIKQVTALYFETTYLSDMAGQAAERGHATSSSAAMLAKKADVQLMISGHYSSRYRDIERFRQEIEEHFQPLVLGRDGEMINILDYVKSE